MILALILPLSFPLFQSKVGTVAMAEMAGGDHPGLPDHPVLLEYRVPLEQPENKVPLGHLEKRVKLGHPENRVPKE